MINNANIKYLGVLFICILLTASITGCIGNPTDNIKGYVVNANTEYIQVDIYRESSNELEESVKVDTGSSKSIRLSSGNYMIEAYELNGDFIGSIEFLLTPNAVDFYISVFTNKVTARSN